MGEYGKRRWMVNTENCPGLKESVEQQVNDKNGEPDKAIGFDYINDAQGYFLAYRYSIRKRTIGVPLVWEAVTDVTLRTL